MDVRCECVARVESWPYAKRCELEAQIRVRLFEPESAPHELDLCQPHLDEAAAMYPDAIQTVRSYS